MMQNALHILYELFTLNSILKQICRRVLHLTSGIKDAHGFHSSTKQSHRQEIVTGLWQRPTENIPPQPRGFPLVSTCWLQDDSLFTASVLRQQLDTSHGTDQVETYRGRDNITRHTKAHQATSSILRQAQDAATTPNKKAKTDCSHFIHFLLKLMQDLLGHRWVLSSSFSKQYQ
jgi:hypothetical protein